MAVAETGSLTAAGRRLGMSQPTVGRRIRALEDHFGTPLLRREDGALTPTRFGQSMLENISRMQDEASAIDRSSATLEEGLKGVVRISATPGVGTSWLPVVMQHFRAAHPDIMIDLGIGFRPYNLARREADIAVRWVSPGEQNSLIARKVASPAFGLYASPDYLARKGRPQSLDDLVQHDGVIAQRKGHPPLWLMDEKYRPYNMPERVTFKSNSLWAFNEAVDRGYGIALLPILAAVRDERKLERLFPEVTQQEDIYLVAHEDLKRSARIRAVFDFLVDAFAQDAAWFLEGGKSVFRDNDIPNMGSSAGADTLAAK